MAFDSLPAPKSIPSEFVRRRLHSLAGLFFVLFLFEHLLTNSRAAFLLGNDGAGFITMVNLIHSLPLLPFIEIFLLAVPIAIHLYLGLIYLYEAKTNSWKTDGSKPAIRFPRNYAFSWQRITSLILVIGLLAHVINMRFMHHPQEIGKEGQYSVEVAPDQGLKSLAPRLNTELIEEDPWVAVAPDFGTAALLLVRENFRTPWICVLYTIFVLAAAFHAANGLWTFSISWGIALNENSRRIVRLISNLFGLLLATGGLAAIWLSYWVNLRS
jgi:succinate dehydrogenase / fumarate reductase cytochrome b subunit